MASEAQCRHALEQLAAQLGQAGAAQRGRGTLDRSLSCHVPDLDVTFRGQLRDGDIEGISTDPTASKAQIRFTVGSDDLVAIADGRLSFGDAYSAGRLKVQASILDLLKLKSLA